MNGFEYQVAGHLLWEGMVQEGLAVARAVHDRYHASRRNPWNEVECGDHYVRSMASYGVFTAASGFEYHGPHGRLAFAPRLTPEQFQAAFVVAEGWGSFHQERSANTQTHSWELKWGRLQIKSFGGELAPDRRLARVTARLDGQPMPVTARQTEQHVETSFSDRLLIPAGARLEIEFELAV
jgi:hypothetical protein